MNIPDSILNTLTDEQKKKVEAVSSPEELLTLAKEAGYELTTDQLETVAGGGWKCDSYVDPCPRDYCPCVYIP